MQVTAKPQTAQSQPVSSTIDMVNKFLKNNLNQVEEASDSDEDTKDLIAPILTSKQNEHTATQLSECQFDITVSEQSFVAQQKPEMMPAKANEDLMNLADEFLKNNQE